MNGKFSRAGNQGADQPEKGNILPFIPGNLER